VEKELVSGTMFFYGKMSSLGSRHLVLTRWCNEDATARAAWIQGLPNNMLYVG